MLRLQLEMLHIQCRYRLPWESKAAVFKSRSLFIFQDFFKETQRDSIFLEYVIHVFCSPLGHEDCTHSWNSVV